ncbi:uncharacterized protein MONOS_3739 [Monocercomonoides exilis]|uniref:uncharacterized protein n=1 Tax=Monocercomonoides exilis TaxID=2049356 RepID=UPI0035597436|nr:hypothetical protein MONOS_3739 [Monocercomonoides exilis]
MQMQESTETDNTKMFNKLFYELEDCDEEEQKVKIEEMNEIIDGMNKDEFKYIYTVVLFDKMDKMIEEKKLNFGNAILLLKYIGCWKILKFIWAFGIDKTSLNKRFKKLITDEKKKNEVKNEKFLTDLCGCCLLHRGWLSSKFLSICVPCLLKVKLNKDESKESQKDVEIALLALSNIPGYHIIEKELCLNEIKEIVQYHQEHHNLTRLAYQSAWQFLMYEFEYEEDLEGVIVNELHFIKEASTEMEELSNSVDLKRKEEGKGERKVKEMKEELILKRWLKILEVFFSCCKLWSEEYVELIGSIVQMFRASRDNYPYTNRLCLYSLGKVSENRNVKIDHLMNIGAIDLFLEEILQPTLNDIVAYESFSFFINVSKKLKENTDDEKEKGKRKEVEMKLFEKMEEEGYEEIITNFYETIDFLNEKHHDYISLDIFDFFADV